MDSLLIDAYEISKKVISTNGGDLGIYAGSTHFREYWSRDSMFTIFGSASTHPKLSKRNLETFIKYQSDEGQIPLTISEVHRILRSFGIEKKLETLFYRHDYPFGGKAQDSNLLFIIAFGEYIKQTKDKEFLHKYIDNVVKASKWSLQFQENDLLKEGKIANWMDTLLYSGLSMYTNVLFYKSMLSLADLYKESGTEGYEEYIEKSLKIKKAIDKAFWRGEYYSRWADNDDFTGSGNALAMMYEIPDQVKSSSIVSYIQSKKLDVQPLLEAESKVPIRKRRIFPALLGMYEYWNTPWQWIGCAYSVGLLRYQPDTAKVILQKIAQTIVDNGTTYEILDREGMMGRSKIYHSERDFSWTAGLYIYAYERFSTKTSYS